MSFARGDGCASWRIHLLSQGRALFWLLTGLTTGIFSRALYAILCSFFPMAVEKWGQPSGSTRQWIFVHRAKRNPTISDGVWACSRKVAFHARDGGTHMRVNKTFYSGNFF